MSRPREITPEPRQLDSDRGQGGILLAARNQVAAFGLAGTRIERISADYRYVVTYNGELNNYRELRAELEVVGYWFCSKSDTKELLHALAHLGNAALARFNGMFAFALWDRKAKQLLLAGDRYGVKPLHVAPALLIKSLRTRLGSRVTRGN